MSNYLILLTLLLSGQLHAHNVVGGVYALGSLIEGEAGFSNGDMAKAGSVVRISDAVGSLISETSTDGEGLFSFQATQRMDHHFHLNLGSGHVLDMVLPAEELPEVLQGSTSAYTASQAVMQTTAETKQSIRTAADSVNMSAANLQLVVERAVAKQIKPLRKEISAYKEKASLQDALGGIGYILGLCGMGIWLQQRKQGKARASFS